MKHISSERKTNIINRYYNGDPVAELTEATGIARSTIYGWLKADRESAKKPVTKKTVNDLNRAIIRLSTQIEILQKVFVGAFYPLGYFFNVIYSMIFFDDRCSKFIVDFILF